jgi:transcriptional regulator of acetoin/glycerol metabolism
VVFVHKEFSYQELFNKWEKFINGGHDVSHLRKEVAASWLRCRQNNVNPYKVPPLLDESEVRELMIRNCDLLDIVNPFLTLIDDLTKETNFIFVLTDNKGNLLDVRGSEREMEHAKKNNFVRGANRSESAGTHAISLALLENKPMQLVGPEHYNIHFHRWTCSAAPIHDMNGKIIGVICLSGHYSLKHKHTLGMVVSLAKAIERELVFKETMLKKTLQPLRSN